MEDEASGREVREGGEGREGGREAGEGQQGGEGQEGGEGQAGGSEGKGSLVWRGCSTQIPVAMRQEGLRAADRGGREHAEALC